MKRTNQIKESVIAKMLTENTGADLCDSGGAYGRNHERNAGKGLEYWRAQPQVRVFADIWTNKEGETTGYLSVTINLFHFLDICLGQYQSKMTRDLWRFSDSAAMKDESWLKATGHYIEDKLKGKGEGWNNSYNGDSNLSQVIQYQEFEDGEGDRYVALQIHGGCDVRGGYTKPRIFSLSRHADKSLYEGNRFSITDGDHTWDFDGCEFEQYIREKGEKELDIGKAPFTKDLEKKGNGTHIFVDESNVPHSPLNGKEIVGYLI
jgi:hypothetical protein